MEYVFNSSVVKSFLFECDVLKLNCLNMHYE